MASGMHKLAIITTHPIQYYAPVFRGLAASPDIDLRVFYTWSQCTENAFDPGFAREIEWDLPLLDGYQYQFVPNVSARPGTESFNGLITPTLAREIESWGADVVLVYTWNSRAHLTAMRHFKGRRPVLFRGDSTLIDARPWWRGVARRVVLTWVYSHIDCAIAVGSNNHDYFRWCGVPAERIAYAPHSVDTLRFGGDSELHEARARAFRSELGIDPAALVILFAGKLQRKKNPFLLLEAFASLNSGAHLVFVGNGELEGELERRASAQTNVHLLPFQNQSVMPAVYRLGDVFVLPSQGPEETWGLAVNEAMASGRPVIASSKVGGARDLIRTDENGWTFESGDRQDLESALRRAVACGRPGLRSMGEIAQRSSARWSTDVSVRKIRDAVLACRSLEQSARGLPLRFRTARTRVTGAMKQREH
jgi:glycosyltransferase involved in cell wall biosynthesis